MSSRRDCADRQSDQEQAECGVDPPVASGVELLKQLI